MTFLTRPIDPVVDPLPRDPTCVWMTAGLSLWGWGETARLEAGTGPGRFARIRDQFVGLVERAEVEDAVDRPGTGPLLFASMTFDERSPDSVAVVPQVVVGTDGEQWWMTTSGDRGLPEAVAPPPHDRARYAGASVPEVDWLEAVAEVIRRIGQDDLEKVVMARDYAVWAHHPFHAPRLLGHLAHRFPGCHVFRVGDLVGASPEMLVRQRGQDLTSVVLAGSAPAFEDEDQDAAAAAALAASEKDQWEHRLSVESVLSVLGPLADKLDHTAEPEVLRLANVQHLSTIVTARLSGRHDAMSLAGSLHPTAAVGGTPASAAVALIRELEGMDRGRYAGPVGWMGRSGDGDIAIALRCAQLSGARARLFTGAGVVAGSLPEAELAETRLKLRAMMGALEAG